MPGTDYQPKWRNASDELIDSSAKAEHMAHVEAGYRDKARELGNFAAFAADQKDTHPLAAIGAQMNYEDAVRTVQDGARAVEAAGQEFDAMQAQGMEQPVAEAPDVDLTKHQA